MLESQVGRGVLRSLTYHDEATASYSKGDLASGTLATGESTRFLSYSKAGQLTKSLASNGSESTFEYGARQRLISSTLGHPGAWIEKSKFGYDNVGQMTQYEAPDGRLAILEYDQAHRLTRYTDGVGNATNLQLDAKGNVTNENVRNNAGDIVKTQRYSFDALGRVANAGGGEESSTAWFAYDRNGNLTNVQDSLKRNWRSYFDRFDRLSQQHLPSDQPGKLSGTILFGYDAQDSLTTVIDPRSLVTRFLTNGFGETVALISPDTGRTDYFVDTIGRLTKMRDGRGFEMKYEYDPAGRITTRGESSYAYGEAGSMNAGRLVSISNGSGKMSFSQDQATRSFAYEQTVSNGREHRSFKVTYQLGATGSSTGRIASIVYPSGTEAIYEFDSAGRISSISLRTSGSQNSIKILSDVIYTAEGAVERWIWGDRVAGILRVYEREFDSRGRLRSYPLGNMGQHEIRRTLNYDVADRIIAFTHSPNADAHKLDQRFEYDAQNRLKSVLGVDARQFEYDVNGNRTAERIGAHTYKHSISLVNNRLLETSGPYPAKVNQFDAAGNLLDDGSIQFDYNGTERLRAITSGGKVTSYRYNGLSQRIAKITPDDSSYYVYHKSGQLLGEYDKKGSVVQETIYLGMMPVAVVKLRPAPSDSGKAFDHFYIYSDHLSTARVIIRPADGAVVWRWISSDPFGTQQPEDDPSQFGTFGYNPRLPGQIFDSETGNHYNYFRDYDPQTGRYVQSDPIGLRGGINTYGYAGSNPLSNIDPDGRLFILPAFYYGGGALIAAGITYYSLQAVVRPGAMSRLEERHFDRICAKADDPCLVLKAAVMAAIADARGKMEAMKNDKVLFQYAHSVANPSITGTNTTWIGHANDLNGRTNNIWAMITLGRKMNCDMLAETAAAMTIYTPGAPIQ